MVPFLYRYRVGSMLVLRRLCFKISYTLIIYSFCCISFPTYLGLSSDLFGGFADFSSPAATATLPSAAGMHVYILHQRI